MGVRKYYQPKLGQRILSLLSRYEIEHFMSGDCGEEFNELIEERGKTKTLSWYWGQVFYALAAYVKLSMRIGVAMIKNYIKTSWRNIKNNKSFSFINIMGLAVGMACCILILLWVRDELSYDKFHENYNDIYRAVTELQGTKYTANPLAMAGVLKEKNPEILKISRFYSSFWLIKHEDKMYNERGALVDDDFFEIFTFPLLKGSQETVFAGRESIVITERIAAKYFGTEDPIGQSLLINNASELIVTGIVENVPTNSHLQFDFLVPMKIMGDREHTSWSWEAATYMLLQKNVSWRDFEKKISGVVNERDERTNQKVTLYLQPFSQIHLYSLNGTDPIIYVYIFLTIAIAILVIACINFVNLSTAKSNTRAKEIGMRKVVGADRANIIRQFLGESLLMSVLSLLAAIALVYLLLPAFNRLAQKQLTLDISGNLVTALGLIGIALFAGLLSGIYPAFMLSRFKPA